MKRITYISLMLLTSCIVTFGQEPKVVAQPVEGSKPFIITPSQLENLEIAASMDRFDKTNDNAIKARLDMFTSLISPQNKTVEYVIQLQGEDKKTVSRNMEFIYNYLVEKKKINTTKISFAIAPEGKEHTEFWLIPNKDISVPSCQDCAVIQAEDEEKIREYFQVKKSKK